VGQRRDENAFEVVEDCVERFAGFGRCVRERIADVTRCNAGQNGIALGVRKVVSNPLDQGVAVPAEFFGLH
jgi:hypothetical protein